MRIGQDAEARVLVLEGVGDDFLPASAALAELPQRPARSQPFSFCDGGRLPEGPPPLVRPWPWIFAIAMYRVAKFGDASAAVIPSLLSRSTLGALALRPWAPAGRCGRA